MSDTDDEYLDDYVQNLLHEAVSGVSNQDYQPPGDFNYQEESARAMFVDEGRRHERISSPIIETYALRKSFSSPAIPEYGRYVRCYPAPCGNADYEGVYRTESAPYNDINEGEECDPRSPEYFRSLRNPYLNDRFMREQVHVVLASPYHYSPAGGSEDSFERLEYDGRETSTWAQSGVRYECSEEPADGPEYRYGQRDKSFKSDEEDSYLEDCEGEERGPIIRLMEKEMEIALPKPQIYSSNHPEELYDPHLSRAERHIDYLCNRLDELVSERDELIDYLKGREYEWREMSDCLHAEILDLRQQNTTLLSERFTKGRRLSKRMASALLKTQQETDRALSTTIERQQKINELRLLVTMQQRYIISLEEGIYKLQARLDGYETQTMRQEDQGEGSTIENATPALSGLPQRHPAEGHRYSSMNDVIHCDRAKYIPSKTTDPELATAQVFNFGGDQVCHSRDRFPKHQCTGSKGRDAFDPLDVPYLRGGIHSN